MDTRRRTGAHGELLARTMLEGRGHTVLATNWRSRHGEIDLVTATDDDSVHIVEVRTRRGGGFGSPAESVTADKRRRLRGLASEWLAHQSGTWSTVSFDVVSVRLSDGLAPEIEYLEGVF